MELTQTFLVHNHHSFVAEVGQNFLWIIMTQVVYPNITQGSNSVDIQLFKIYKIYYLELHLADHIHCNSVPHKGHQYFLVHNPIRKTQVRIYKNPVVKLVYPMGRGIFLPVHPADLHRNHIYKHKKGFRADILPELC